MKGLVLFTLVVTILLGCTEEGFEYSSMRFGVEQGLKSTCDGELKCLDHFDQLLKTCLSKDDVRLLVATPTSELDAKVTELSLKTLQCINNK